MKIRSVHPGFFSDARIARLTMAQRVLLLGLWCRADDYGRGDLLPRAILGDVFPRDEIEAGELWEMVSTLELLGLIVAYSDDQGDRYYYVPNWDEYQSPKYRAKTSIPHPTPGADPEDPNPPRVRQNPGQLGDKASDDTERYGTTPEDPGQFGQDSAEFRAELEAGEGVGEGEGEGEGVGALARPGNYGKLPPPKAYFEALEQTWQQKTPTGKAELGKWRAAVRALRDAGARPDEVRAVYAAFASEFPDASVTVTAIQNHVGRLVAIVRGEAPPKRRGPAARTASALQEFTRGEGS